MERRVLYRTLLLALAFIASTLVLTTTGTASQNDDCPGTTGNSSEDRIGCPDTDGDGWSDPDENWTIQDGADAFWEEATQWSDRDGDGYGDTSSFDARLIDHFPDDEHLHRAVLSVGCNPPDHTLPLGDSSHFRCTVKNEALVPVRIIPEWDSGEGVSSSELPSKIDLEEQGFGGDSYEIRLDFTATKIGLTSGTLYFNETSESTPVYSLPLGILVESSTPTTSSKGVTPYLDPVYQKVVGLASWISQETGVNFAPQSVVALLIVGPLIVFTIARRTQSSLKTRRAEQESLEQQAASEEQRKAEAEENTQSESLSIEEMASDPNQPVKKPKRGVKGAEGRVLAPGMVEMMVGNIDMPHEPSDAFNVLTKSLGDSDIGGADWNDELAEINNDDETDFTVAAKHRTSKTNNRAQEIDSESETQTRINSKPQGKKRTKSSATKKAKARTQTQKQTQKRAHTQTQSKKQGEMKSSKSKVRSKIKSESIPSNTNQKASEKAKKKRGKKGGKVGHTRGPGIDLK